MKLVQSIILIIIFLSLVACKHVPAPKSQLQQPLLMENNERISNLPVTDTAVVMQLLKHADSIGRKWPDSVLYLSYKALSLSQNLLYNRGIARSLQSIAQYFFDKKQYNKSKALFLEAIPYSFPAKAEDPLLIPQLYNGIAGTYNMESIYDSALWYYYQSVSVIKVEKTIDTALLVKVYENIGALLANTGQHEQALYYLKFAISYAKTKKDTLFLARGYHNLGVAYQDNIDSAIAYITTALNIYQLKGDSIQVQEMYTNIGTLLVLKNNPQQAKPYLDSAISAYPKGVANSYALQQGLGGLNYRLKNYKLAIQYYERSLVICKEQGVQHDKLYAYWTLADLYNKTGNNNKAYQYLQIHALLAERLMSKTIAESINQQEVKYRTSEKSKELIQKQLLITRQQNKIQQQYQLLTVTLLLILLFIVAFLGLLRRKQHKAALAELQARLAGEEMERMRISRELHDGIGGLLSAAKMSLTYSPFNEMTSINYNNSIQLLDNAYRELRQTAHNLSPEILKHKGLIEAARIFCEKTMQSKNTTISFQSFGILPSLKDAETLSIYRILQELVHNAIKHAHATYILVQISIEDSYLNLTVEDDGIGIINNLKTEGIGLSNLQSRVEALRGNMDVDSRAQEGTTVYLKFSILNLQ